MASATGKRNTKTEAKIKSAFTTLVKSKGFEAMTVSDIARTADINRGTFYMHYVDKFNLRQQLINDTIDDLTRILVERVNPTEPTISQAGKSVVDVFQSQSIAQALQYVKNDYAFFDAISQSGNDMSLYERFKDVLKRLIITQAKHRDAEPQTIYNGIPADYAMEILVSAVASIVWLWIRRGCKEAPEEICLIIERNKTTAPADILW